jgi:hypothetical protein
VVVMVFTFAQPPVGVRAVLDLGLLAGAWAAARRPKPVGQTHPAQSVGRERGSIAAKPRS